MAEDKIKNNEVAPFDEFGKTLISWQFPEFELIKRGRAWYIIGAIVAILLLVYSYFTQNPLFALIVVIGVIMTVMMARRTPSVVNILITDRGVLVGDTFSSYRELKDFAIVYDPPSVKKLYLETRNVVRPRFTVLLEDVNPVKVREILLQYLDEDLEREEEASSEALTRMFKL